MVGNFSFIINKPGRKLAGMAKPGSGAPLKDDLRFLVSKGIGAVVSLTESGLDAGQLKSQGLTWLHLPIMDFTPPSRKQVADFLKFVETQFAEGRAVAVHCASGCGRTGTMLACYLTHKGMEPGAAIAEVRRLRPHSIETPEQELAVYDTASGLSNLEP